MCASSHPADRQHATYRASLIHRNMIACGNCAHRASVRFQFILLAQWRTFKFFSICVRASVFPHQLITDDDDQSSVVFNYLRRPFLPFLIIRHEPIQNAFCIFHTIYGMAHRRQRLMCPLIGSTVDHRRAGELCVDRLTTVQMNLRTALGYGKSKFFGHKFFALLSPCGRAGVCVCDVRCAASATAGAQWRFTLWRVR